MEKQVKQVVSLIDEYQQVWDDARQDLFFDLEKHFSRADWDELWNHIWQLSDDDTKLIFGWECIFQAPAATKYIKYLDLLKQTTALDWSQKYFMLWQATSSLFVYKGERPLQISERMYEIYNDISEDFMAHFTLEPIAQRNDNLVFVIIQQFLNETHGPTKTALDRARVLREKLGKQVIIINTAEQMGGTPIGLMHYSCANYDESMLSQEMVEYQGKQYPYIQFDNNMPNIYNCQELFDFVRKYKPGFIINIGGSSLAADACSKIVPVLNVNTVPSGIERTKTTMQVCGNPVSDGEAQLLGKIGKSRADVLCGRFTSSLKQQRENYTKAQLGIPENKTILAVIGGRLTQEMDAAFIQMLDGVLSEGAVVVIIGVMNRYEEICQNDMIFRENSVYLGMQEDVLAILDCCDIYVNPRRIGGGTSVIEAMYKGLPAVSIEYGDVALGAGKEFCVADYAAMQAQLLRFIKDKAYYQEMSGKAKQRAAYMLDSDSAFTEIVEKFLQKTEGIGKQNDE